MYSISDASTGPLRVWTMTLVRNQRAKRQELPPVCLQQIDDVDLTEGA